LPARQATVVHDGSAFRLAAELRRRGYQVSEGPLLSASVPQAEPGQLAVIATRSGAARSERLREWARQLCWNGAPVLAVGAAVGPVAELFGSLPSKAEPHAVSGRLADIQSASEGLFQGLRDEFRLALPAGDRFEAASLSAEFSITASSRDGELIGASHVFRPIHLLHAAALESQDTRSIVLENLARFLRERGGRAF
jgi:hypothetical protein